MSDPIAQEREITGAAVVGTMREMMAATSGTFSSLQLGPIYKPYGRDLRDRLTTFRHSARAKGAEIDVTDNDTLTIIVVRVRNGRRQEV